MKVPPSTPSCSTNENHTAERQQFRSVLFPEMIPEEFEDALAAPTFFSDLNLDRIVAGVTSGKEYYQLVPYYRMPLQNKDGILFRQAVMNDLENNRLADDIKSFAQSMRHVHSRLAQAKEGYYQHQNERLVLEAIDDYCEAIKRLVDNLSAAPLRSCGLREFQSYVSNYTNSDRFISLFQGAKYLLNELSSLRYELSIRGGYVEVKGYERKPNYSTAITQLFARFSQPGSARY